MRNELKPSLKFPEKTFRKIFRLVCKATSFLRQNNRTYVFPEGGKREILIKRINERLEHKEFREIEENISKIAGIDMNQYHYPEFWILRGKNITFIFTVSEPKVINNITKDELTEIVTKIWNKSFLETEDMKLPIAKVYGDHLIEYYVKLLDANFYLNSSGIIEKYNYENCIRENYDNHVCKQYNCEKYCWYFSRSITQIITDIVDEIWENRYCLFK